LIPLPTSLIFFAGPNADAVATADLTAMPPTFFPCFFAKTPADSAFFFKSFLSTLLIVFQASVSALIS